MRSSNKDQKSVSKNQTWIEFGTLDFFVMKKDSLIKIYCCKACLLQATNSKK